jgi:hypothetical protein
MNITRHLHPMQIPVLDINSYFSFLSGTMITLFVISLIIIFVYEYEVLRRPKS